MFETLQEIYLISSELVSIVKDKIAVKVYNYFKENKKC